jgi:prophage regulatory protein
MKVLSQQQVIDLTGLSRVSIWRYERANLFPNRIKLGPNRVGWRSDEVEAWIESRPRGIAQPADSALHGGCGYE